MITGEIKSRVDRIWDTMWSGGISNPLTVIEQLTYLLFIKRLDELHTIEERKAARTKKPMKAPIFGEDQQHLRWSRLKDVDPESMHATVRDEVFPFIKTLGNNGGSAEEGDSTYSHYMKDATFMIPTPRVLANVVDQLEQIEMADTDTKGDLYEYMLGKIASAGQNGQFRTPRHIIKLMVEMTAPTPKDVICDPACGTAGFLIAASEYLREHHGKQIYKNEVSRRKFNSGTFHGYDFDNTMLRIGSMNMLLHGVENPDIRYRDSLSQSEEDDSESFSLVLANPPFTGSLDFESADKSLLSVAKTKKTELLFLALFERILIKGGRAAVIVPAGVLESDGSAQYKIRKMLVESLNLEAVIKLPHWVFKPYASVDTSILLFSKGGKTGNVWFYRVDNDGFADDAQKTPISGSELDEVLYLWRNEKSRSLSVPKKHRTVPVDEIRDHGYDLCPPMYLSAHKYPDGEELVAIGDLFDIVKGGSPASSATDEGEFPFVTSAIDIKRTDRPLFEGPAICVPTVSATGHGHAAIKAVHLVEGKFDAASITAVLLPKHSDVPVIPIYYYLLAHKDDLLVPLMRGATNKSLNVDRLSQLKIPVLSDESPEARSVNSLMELREEIAKTRNKLKALREKEELRVASLRDLGTQK